MDELNTVGYVEDDEDIRAIAELALRDIGGLQVGLFENGYTAVEGMAQLAPQMIILDVMMPGLNGLQTLEKLREIPSLESTPVIFMTAKAQPDEISQYKAAGAVDVVIKPFDPMTLADTIRAIWARSKRSGQ